MSQNELDGMRLSAMLKSVERQRNDTLAREVQKDAVIALLQAQNEALMNRLKAAEATIESQQPKTAAPVAEPAKARKSKRAA